jgi:hypothetical protein
MSMSKKRILLTLLGLLPLLLGGVKGGLATAVVEMMINGPKKRLARRGVLGYILALGISLLIPLMIKRIFPSKGTAQ